MRDKVERELELAVTRPEDMPDCFGKLFNPEDTECLQCTAFNMCAYFLLKDYPHGYLDEARILHVTDEDIYQFIGHTKTPIEVAAWLLKEGRTIDKTAVKLRLKRFLRDDSRASYKNGKITVL